jgi:hypothetical protein
MWTSLYKEVNCSGPSPSVRIPWTQNNVIQYGNSQHKDGDSQKYDTQHNSTQHIETAKRYSSELHSAWCAIKHNGIQRNDT